MKSSCDLPGGIQYSSKFSRSNNFVIFVRCKRNFYPRKILPLWACLLEQQ